MTGGRAGVLFSDLDMSPESLGYTFCAHLWLSASPAHLVSISRELREHPEVAFAAAHRSRHRRNVNVFGTRTPS